MYVLWQKQLFLTSEKENHPHKGRRFLSYSWREYCVYRAISQKTRLLLWKQLQTLPLWISWEFLRI